MKRSNILILIISILVLSSLIPSFVNAAPPKIDFKSIGTFFTTTFTYILNPGGGGADLFARGLLFILLIAVLYAAAKKVPVFSDKTALLVAAIVSIIGVRFLSIEMIRGILLPYGALTITVSVLLPFILFFYFIEGTNKLIRKAGWLFFFIIMLGLWFMRWSDIGAMAYAYVAFGALSLVLFIWDGTFHKLFLSIGLEKTKSIQAKEQISILKGKRSDLITAQGAAGLTSVEMAQIQRQINSIDRRLKGITKLT